MLFKALGVRVSQGRLAMLKDYILPDKSFVPCPNQDMVYGLGAL
jgi:hypothetical protein